MNTSSNEIIDCESVSVRIAPGEYFQFPVVDNKGLFPHFFRSESKSDLQLQTNCIDEYFHALYQRKGNVFYLVCAWQTKEEINNAALDMIKANPKFHHILN